jgi:hypothetical protein
MRPECGIRAVEVDALPNRLLVGEATHTIAQARCACARAIT